MLICSLSSRSTVKVNRKFNMKMVTSVASKKQFGTCSRTYSHRFEITLVLVGLRVMLMLKFIEE